MLALAGRNNLPPPYPSPEAARAAYNFSDLQDFLDLYYYGASVLRTRRDFFDLAMAYFKRAAAANVVRAEVFFDPQTHVQNGLAWSEFMGGLVAAAEAAEAGLGLSVAWIMCFRKDLSIEDADATLTAALPWLRRGIVAVGLDSSEAGHPPAAFAAVFERAAGLGLLAVAHAGEEGQPEYVWEALDVLHVRRVDHGVHCLDDPPLRQALVERRVPLTVCPVSNLRLGVYPGQLPQRLSELVRTPGLLVTVNSDDAAYFGAYVEGNYEWLAQVAGLGVADVARLAMNSLEASFIWGSSGGSVGGGGGLMSDEAGVGGEDLMSDGASGGGEGFGSEEGDVVDSSVALRGQVRVGVHEGGGKGAAMMRGRGVGRADGGALGARASWGPHRLAELRARVAELAAQAEAAMTSMAVEAGGRA
ncbi:hypothetical protein HYH03_005984 [Edaphochlamys debaryana]|uniref:Adenosine deaminase domain-containing protein n=1 Tax=Edaphochlamys debaryana TaxID=47281 RepID=A0A835Y4Q3_9CHLO|nr:hypothetical protein HYH03_005984 [Edaphochlamys debaryana]|eukprot:KAG2496065.1 hypothetical protein HYH03_005984 [Edaphochlamys debaryana]